VKNISPPNSGGLSGFVKLEQFSSVSFWSRLLLTARLVQNLLDTTTEDLTTS